MDPVDQHYGRRDFATSILGALRADGKDPDRLQPDALAAFEHFHIRGQEATLDLARLAGIKAGDRVLDAGGGFGGPARLLARHVGCHVTVVDITEAYVEAGAELTRRVGLGDRVQFRHGSALDIPSPDGSFDVAWTQHSSMNIRDKERLYRELHRVVRPGGCLAIHEIMAGTNQPVHFPVPWAREPSISFLRPPAEMRRVIAEAGFEERHWLDESARARDWFQQRLASPPPPVRLNWTLLLGQDMPAMLQNILRNLQEERIAVVMGVWDRR